ncbi:glycyl radical protein [Chloroflexota bacterium]
MLTKVSIEQLNQATLLTDRVRKRKQEYLDARVHIASERSRLVTESWKETEGQPIVIRRAKAFKHLLEGNSIAIREDELIVGCQTKYVHGINPNVESETYGALHKALSKEEVQSGSPSKSAVLSEEDRQILLEDTEYWKGKNAPDQVEEEWRRLWGNKWDNIRTVRIGSPVHMRPAARTGDWGRLLHRGLNGIIAEARERIAGLKIYDETEIRNLQFWEATIIACEGVINYAKRYADLARQMAAEEADEVRKGELEKIAETCDWVPANPTRNFYEAIQSFFICFLALNLEIAGSSEAPGRFDQYMYPFLKKDIDEGKITYQEAGELLALFLVKLMEFDSWGTQGRQYFIQGSQNMNLTLAGVDRNGNDASNELTFLFLEVLKVVRPHQPHVSFRYHDGINPVIMIKAVETNRDHGGGIPAFFNDKVSLLSLTQKGIPLEDAREWIPQGCVERTIGSASGLYSGGPFYNMPKMLEITLNNGVDPRSGIKIGLETGDPRKFTTYEEFLEAFKKQVGYFVDVLVDHSNVWFVIRQGNLMLPYNSALLPSCMESGVDTMAGGARWSKKLMAVMRPFGHQNTANSLAAIKKLVYEEKQVSMDRLLNALKNNFEGDEELQGMLLAAPKWGNDDDYVDEIMVDMFNWTQEQVTVRKNPWGEPWAISRQGLTYHYFFGTVTGALPDGRKAEIPFADGSVSAMRGTDMKGPTAVFNSASKVDQIECDATLLNLKFFPGPLQTREGINKFISLIKNYFDNYGHHCQFNIWNRETLLEAQQHPEEYRDLVVRVAGFSAFFVELSREVQDEILSRTEHAVA